VARPSPQGRLVALGVAEPTARALIEQHEARVVDALDAVDTLQARPTGPLARRRRRTTGSSPTLSSR
jgi:hypothetical protein